MKPTRIFIVAALHLCILSPLVVRAEAPAGAGDEEVDKMLKIGVPTTQPQGRETDASDAQAELPRVLLIGDSISGGYLNAVAGRLKGVATVQRGNNGGPSGAGLAKIDQIVGGGPWDIIHFNWGLHDMTWQFRMKPEDRGIKAYQERLEKIVTELEKTNAKLIWATTTPWCPETYAYVAKRYRQELKYTPEQEQEWKNAALEVMKRHNVEVNDLHALLLPQRDKYLKSLDDVHFNSEGNKVMGEQIAEVLKRDLATTQPSK